MDQTGQILDFLQVLEQEYSMLDLQFSCSCQGGPLLSYLELAIRKEGLKRKLGY
jgi:hypothetical protein